MRQFVPHALRTKWNYKKSKKLKGFYHCLKCNKLIGYKTRYCDHCRGI